MASKICKCEHCGKEFEIYEWKTYPKVVDGVCCYCLFEETNTNEILGLNIKPDGSAFEIINRVIKDINIPREQLYWFISRNNTAKMYLSIDGNYWHKDCMDDTPSVPPEHTLQRALFLRKKEDLGKQWSEFEYLRLRKKYESVV